MQSIHYIVRRYIGGTDHRAPAGPAAVTLVSVAERTAVVIRFVAVAYVIVQVGIWHSFYAAETWRLAGPAVAAGWVVVLVILLARHRPSAWLIVADSAVLVALALSGTWWVPQEMRGDTASWLFVLLAAQSIFPLWCARLALGAPLVLASGVAYWAGAVFLSPALAPNSAPGASTALVFAVGAIAWIGYQTLEGRAARADTSLAEADAAEHDQYIALCRHAERREHERLLHDTVLNTLTALARLGTGEGASEGDLSEVIGRCRHDVTLMEYALGGSTGADQGAQERDPNAHALVAIEAIALEMRARGLDVHVQAIATGDEQASGADRPGRVPVPVVAAVARAVREALTNVARHAGTGEAWVDVFLPEGGTGLPNSGGLTVTVRDCGVGFDPGRVGPDRLGIGRSIIERIADCGGTASVHSSQGNGTTVTLHVPARGAASPSPHPRLSPHMPLSTQTSVSQHTPVSPHTPPSQRTRALGWPLMPRGMR